MSVINFPEPKEQSGKISPAVFDYRFNAFHPCVRRTAEVMRIDKMDVDVMPFTSKPGIADINKHIAQRLLVDAGGFWYSIEARQCPMVFNDLDEFPYEHVNIAPMHLVLEVGQLKDAMPSYIFIWSGKPHHTYYLMDIAGYLQQGHEYQKYTIHDPFLQRDIEYAVVPKAYGKVVRLNKQMRGWIDGR